MQVNSRVQEIWLRLLGAAGSSKTTHGERIEEGYYAVVREAVDPALPLGASGPADFNGLESFIPNLVCTRAVYLNQGGAYGLAKTGSLCNWAGRLGEQVERGVRQAFAVVDPEVFTRHVCANLQASGWSVEHAQNGLRVSDGRFTENVNPLRAIVQMVLSRGSFAEAAEALKADLSERFVVDAGLFERFAEHFAKYRPVVFDHYFTAYPECSCVAAGWDYWQVSDCGAREATGIFEQAMKEFESFLAIMPENRIPAITADRCEHSIAQN
jgi:hypothetical protein